MALVAAQGRSPGAEQPRRSRPPTARAAVGAGGSGRVNARPYYALPISLAAHMCHQRNVPARELLGETVWPRSWLGASPSCGSGRGDAGGPSAPKGRPPMDVLGALVTRGPEEAAAGTVTPVAASVPTLRTRDPGGDGPLTGRAGAGRRPRGAPEAARRTDASPGSSNAGEYPRAGRLPPSNPTLDAGHAGGEGPGVQAQGRKLPESRSLSPHPAV
jgi:hypothetical protein